MTGKGLDTKCVHGGELSPRVDGAISLPVFQTTMYETRGGENYHDIRYIRLNNSPNHEALQAKLAALEGGEDALVASSGMAAITTAVLALVSQGGHILAQDCLYGGTYDFFTKDLPDLGITVDFVDASAPDTWRAKVKPNTQIFYLESMTNPLLQVADHAAAVEFAREHGLISMVDNTFSTPVNFQPLALGYDLSLHSATKFLNGHSDLVAGAVVGSKHLVKRVRLKLNHLGGCMDPHACFLLHRGLKTLSLRVRKQNENAQLLAEALAKQEAVERVYYPGLPEHPGRDRAAALFTGFGGMVSFDLKGGLPAAERLMDRVRLAVPTVSLGGVETLLCLPSRTSHLGMTAKERKAAGIADGLVRVSVGIEDGDDIVEDFTQALAD